MAAQVEGNRATSFGEMRDDRIPNAPVMRIAMQKYNRGSLVAPLVGNQPQSVGSCDINSLRIHPAEGYRKTSLVQGEAVV